MRTEDHCSLFRKWILTLDAFVCTRESLSAPSPSDYCAESFAHCLAIAVHHIISVPISASYFHNYIFAIKFYSWIYRCKSCPRSSFIENREQIYKSRLTRQHMTNASIFIYILYWVSSHSSHFRFLPLNIVIISVIVVISDSLISTCL